jgi:thiosulfate/3-mercaptopyruvate sulfurtransferase
MDQMRAALAARSAQVVDARSAARFRGQAEEPRPGLRKGHVPGAISVPCTEVVSNGFMKPEADIRAVFARAGVDLGRPIINMCGSGVTAAILALAQSIAGQDDAAVYDGSWSEWGAAAAQTPVEAG